MMVSLPLVEIFGSGLCMVFEHSEELEDAGERCPAIAGVSAHASLETSVWSAVDLEDEAIGLRRRG